MRFLLLLLLTFSATASEQIVVEGRVVSVVCGKTSKKFQSYSAKIKVTKGIQGTAPSEIEIPFKVSLKPDPTKNEITFLTGDLDQLTLTQKSGLWIVASPSDKVSIEATSGTLPFCKKKLK